MAWDPPLAEVQVAEEERLLDGRGQVEEAEVQSKPRRRSDRGASRIVYRVDIRGFTDEEGAPQFGTLLSCLLIVVIKFHRFGSLTVGPAMNHFCISESAPIIWDD